MKIEEIEKLSDEELKENLLTADYRGKEFKHSALLVLINREFDRGVRYQRALSEVSQNMVDS